MKKNESKTANETYTARRAEINGKLSRLQELLQDFDSKQKADPASWGFAGSAGHISQELSKLIAHFTGQEE